MKTTQLTWFKQQYHIKFAAASLCASCMFGASAHALQPGPKGGNPPPLLTGSKDEDGKRSVDQPPLLSGSSVPPPHPAVECYREEIKLTGSNALSPNAAGVANLTLNTVSGTNTDIVQVKLQGLVSGTCNVDAILLSSGSAVVLGQIVVPAATSGSGAPLATGTAAPRPPKRGFHFGLEATFGTPSRPLPASVSVNDIAGIAIKDATNTKTYLSGDFTKVATAGAVRIMDDLPIVSGTGAPAAAGRLQIEGEEVNGTKTGRLAIRASGMPATVSGILAINGSDIATSFTADSKGNLVILGGAPTPKAAPASHGKQAGAPSAPGMIPASVDIFDVKTILFHAADGTEFFHVYL